MKTPVSPGSDELQTFLLSRQQRAGADQINWTDRRREWLASIETLYEMITGDLLSDSIANRLVAVSRTRKEITEELLGSYSIDELVLDISGETVRLSPKGRTVMGAQGRVDLVGEFDTVTLVLEPPDHWNIVVSRVPRQLALLDRTSLTEALRRVMR